MQAPCWVVLHSQGLPTIPSGPLWTDPRDSDCRLLDHSNEGFTNWEFMTVHCWGEKAEGEWTLEIQDMPSQVRNREKQGQWLLGWSQHFLCFSPVVSPTLDSATVPQPLFAFS